MNKFNSLTGTAQGRLIEILRETKKAMGATYVPVYITSGLRTPRDHAERVIADKIDKRPNLYNYYKSKNPNSWETSKNVRFYNLIQDQYDGKTIDGMIKKWGISEEDARILKTIKNKNKQDLITASIQLLERNAINGFEGTDHRYGTAVNLRTHSEYTQTIIALDRIIRGKIPLTYGGGSDISENNHMHITLIKTP